MKAILIIRERKVLASGLIREMIVWKLPAITPDRPHGFKYRLFLGNEQGCLVRYDNESGKGDHIHYGETERAYAFVSLEALVNDFLKDCAAMGGIES